MGVISYSNVTLSNINDGVSILSTVVTYAASVSGTIAPSADLTDENGLVLIDSDGEHLITDFTWSDTIPECPEGWYLWARTVLNYSDGSKACIYSVSRQGVNGEKGDKGISVALVYLYQRSTSTPALPSNDIKYYFSNGEIVGNIGKWSHSIPSGVADLWTTFATASSASYYDTIPSSEWTQPVKFVQNGLGVLETTISYGVSNSGSTQPSNWSSNVPTPSKGQWLWIKTVFTYTDGSSVTSYSKSYVGINGYVHVAWANSADGSQDFSTTNSEGKLYIGVCTNETQASPTIYTAYSWSLIRGEDGYNKATINLYRRSDTTPSKPNQTMNYTFSTGILSPIPTVWYTNIPASDGKPCYVTSVSAVSQKDIYTINGDYWTDPVKLVEDGYNQAMVSLYKRSETAPSAPTSSCTYTFATGALSPIPTGWYTEIPEANGFPCYVTSAYAISLGATYEFGSTSWSEPVKFAADGYSQANVQLYKRASTTPSKPGVTTTYTFSTGTLSPIPTGWSLNVPETNSDREPCYITTVKFAIQGDIHTISPNDWSVPVKFVVDGIDGQDGATVNKITQQYCISTSETVLPQNPTWVNDLPEIDSTANPRQWIWSRWKIETDDGNTTYTTPVCSVGISGVSWKADRSNNSIVGQVWQTDINTSINQYDTNNGTTTSLRNRVTTVEQTVNGYDVVVEDVTTHHNGLVDDIASHRMELNQTADKFDLLATFNGELTEFSLTNDMIKAITNQFIIKDSSGSSTVISGGKIAANSITLGEVASDISGLGATATNYIKIDGNNGIKIQDSSDNTDYVRISSSAIDLVRNNASKVYIEDASVRIGELGTSSSKKRNIYITDSAIQFRNYTDVLAKWDSTDGIVLYQGNGNAAVTIGTSGASFTGNISATSGTIGAGSQKINIGTNSTYGSIYYGMDSLSSSNNGFYIGTDGISLGGGKFKVTAAGYLTATSGSIGSSVTIGGYTASSIASMASSGAATATNYITYIDSSNGIQVHNSDDSSDYIRINSDNIGILRNNKLVAEFTDGALRFYDGTRETSNTADLMSEFTRSAINFYANNKKVVGISSSNSAALTFYSPDDGTTQLAQYGSTSMTLGNTSSGYLTASSGGINLYSGSTVLAHIGYGSGKNEGGKTETAPYYDLGIRNENDYPIGNYSVVEGSDNTASGYTSHAEGSCTTAYGLYSHAEGGGSVAWGTASHAEGAYTEANAHYSHAGGYFTTAGSPYQTVIGKYNLNNSSNAFEIGWGTSSRTSDSKNIFSVDTSGNVHIPGSFYVGCNSNGSGGTALQNYSTTSTVSSGNSSLVTSGGVYSYINKATSVSSGGTGLITSGAVYTYVNNKVADLVQAISFNITCGKNASAGNYSTTMSVPSGYKLLCTKPVGVYVSGGATAATHDMSVSVSSGTATIKVYLYPGGITSNLIISGAVLFIKS